MIVGLYRHKVSRVEYLVAVSENRQTGAVDPLVDRWGEVPINSTGTNPRDPFCIAINNFKRQFELIHLERVHATVAA